jgi:tryptophan halogenase
MKIVIVGGGTTGWLTSFILSKTRPHNEYINVSSSSLGIIGVGEGTTGLFRSILTDSFYELNEYEFMKETKSLPKMGIRFKNWTGNSSSFISPIDGSVSSGNFLDTNLYSCILNDIPIEYSAKSSFLCLNNKTNFIVNNKKIDFYEYGMHALHLDTNLTSNFFKRKSLENGVKYVDSIVKNVVVSKEQIDFITLDDGTEIHGDLFIDCSGFKRILSTALNQEFNSFDEYLHVNAGLIFSIEKEPEETPPTTQAIAMKSGWIFEIPKQYGTGRGYIHNDSYTDTDSMVKELEEYYACKVVPKKTINYNCGTLDKYFVGNCVSIGLSSCFVEPLQATSIHCSIVQIMDLIRNCLSNKITEDVKISYNKRTKKLYYDVLDFVSMHYTGGREDTPFWKDIKYQKELSPRVKEIISLSKSRLSRWDDWDTYYGCMNQIVWSSSLAGLGHYQKQTIVDTFNTWGIPIDQTKDIAYSHVNYLSEIESKCAAINDLKEFFKNGL